jgi:hypothetical protein
MTEGRLKLSVFHKSAAAQIVQIPEAEGFVESDCFFRIVGCKFDLVNMGILL